MPGGSVPALVKVGAGVPAVVTVKLNAVPEVAVAVFALVMAGPLLTVEVKAWVAVPADCWRRWSPGRYLAARGGVPDSVAVPSPLSVKVTPDGSAGCSWPSAPPSGNRWSSP